MSNENSPIRTPGEVIREHLVRKGWTQTELAQILDRPIQAINEIIQGKKAITAETAVGLAAAFKTTPDFWMSVESAYRLSLTSGDAADVGRRLRLFEVAPVKDMERRSWIEKTKGLEDLERALCRFFDVTTLDQEPQITVATRRALSTGPLNAAQRAWCFRAKQMARVAHAEKFKPELLPHCQDRLRELAKYADEAKNVSKVLAGYGIRFVVIEPLAGSKIDGAAFWLASDAPVIALSTRYDRIDAFWFTLAHEFAHIVSGDASVDAELVGEAAYPSEAKDDIERRADEYAANMLIPAEKLQSFILRVGPLYSTARINQFAHRMEIHPGIVVGQLQHKGEIKWGANRDSLSKVRSLVTSTALTDGWGHSLSPGAI